MDSGTLINFGLVLVFVLIGGVFAATELALVSLRDSQLRQLEQQSSRGAKIASLARDPNRFLAAVQIGVTVAGFLSAAYGASTLAPDFAPVLERLGLSDAVADTIAFIGMTLFIAYLSLVFGELVPKRLALQKPVPVALAVAPPLARFATLMRPVIWLLSRSTNAVVRLLGGDPHATNDEMTDEELRDIVGAHEGFDEQERKLLSDVFAASERTVVEIMTPRRGVTALPADQPLEDAITIVRALAFSRYPVYEGTIDTIVGFVHVRDLFDRSPDHTVVRDVARTIVAFPESAQLLPSMSLLRDDGGHLAIVVDEYGGTSGIVTLEDMVEEIVGEIRDEFDDPHGRPYQGRSGELIDAGLNLEDFAELTGIDLPDGGYETVAGFVVAVLGRIAAVGDVVDVGEHRLEVAQVDGNRLAAVRILDRGSTQPDRSGGPSA